MALPWLLLRLGADSQASPFSATGSGDATFVGQAIQNVDAALAATGTGTASFVGVEIQSDGAISATGTGTASFLGASTGGQVVPGGGDYVHRGSAYWRQYLNQFRRKSKRKKKEALSELDELIIAVQAHLDTDDDEAVYQKALEEAKGVSLANTLDQIETEIAHLKILAAEIDDEETLLLLM